MKKPVNPLIFSIFLTLVAIVVICIPRTDGEGATRVLEAQGYKSIEITGWRPMAGGKDDFYCTGFEATSPSGQRVSGAVTSGLFKGHTIRLD